MKIDTTLTDSAILSEVGRRLTLRRVAYELTQATLADQAGVSKRTIERLEDGESVQLVNFIRVLRGLDLTHGLDGLLPEPAISPLDAIAHEGRQRRRVRPARNKPKGTRTWSWGDDK